MQRTKSSNENRNRPNANLTDPQGDANHTYGDGAAATITYPSLTHEIRST